MKPTPRKRRSQLPFQNVLQILIELEGVEPTVWRRVLVPDTFFWSDLHPILQAAMGWGMEHDYEFILEEKHGHDADGPDSDGRTLGETRIRESVKAEESFEYLYDPEDQWRHRVTIEAILPRNKLMTYPVCTGGENACPPEECGGPKGYEDLLTCLDDPASDDHENVMEWVGGFFDPIGFDANYVNQELLWPLTEEIL
jgi:hypothetical protein